MDQYTKNVYQYLNNHEIDDYSIIQKINHHIDNHRSIVQQKIDNLKPRPHYQPQIEHLLDIFLDLGWTDCIESLKPYYQANCLDNDYSLKRDLQQHKINKPGTFNFYEPLPRIKLLRISGNTNQIKDWPKHLKILQDDLKNYGQNSQAITLKFFGQITSLILITNTIYPVIITMPIDRILTKSTYASLDKNNLWLVFNAQYQNNNVTLNPAIYQRALMPFNQVTPENIQLIKGPTEKAFYKLFPKAIELKDESSLDLPHPLLLKKHMNPFLNEKNYYTPNPFLNNKNYYTPINESLNRSYGKNITNDSNFYNTINYNIFNPIALLKLEKVKDIPTSLNESITNQINN